MDAVFYADNVYNNKTFNGKPPSNDEPITEEIEWSQHLDNMMNLMVNLGNNSRDSKLSDEMDTGMLNEKGPVVSQIRRQLGTSLYHLSRRLSCSWLSTNFQELLPFFNSNSFQKSGSPGSSISSPS